MTRLNEKLKAANQTSEGFHPSLFNITFNFEGIGELPKVMSTLTCGVHITPEFIGMGINLGGNKVDISFVIDTTSNEFKTLLKYLLNLKNNKPKDGECNILGSITIYYYSKDGSVFMKRKLRDVKFNYDENKYDIFDSLMIDAGPIHELEASFTYEKIEDEI